MQKLILFAVIALVAIVSGHSNSTEKTTTSSEKPTSTEKSAFSEKPTSTERSSTPENQKSTPNDEAIKRQWATYKTKHCNNYILFIHLA